MPFLQLKQDSGSQRSFSSQWSAFSNDTGMNFKPAMLVQRSNTGNYTYASESECEDDMGEESGAEDLDETSDSNSLLTLIQRRKRRRLLSNLDRTDGCAVILENTEALEAGDNEMVPSSHTDEV